MVSNSPRWDWRRGPTFAPGLARGLCRSAQRAGACAGHHDRSIIISASGGRSTLATGLRNLGSVATRLPFRARLSLRPGGYASILRDPGPSRSIFQACNRLHHPQRRPSTGGPHQGKMTEKNFALIHRPLRGQDAPVLAELRCRGYVRARHSIGAPRPFKHCSASYHLYHYFPHEN